MKRIIILACLCVALIPGCAKQVTLEPFTNAGCTFFPTSAFSWETNVSICCLEHDIAYWKGGTEDERWAADEAFRGCLIRITGNEELAGMLVDAARVGGTPHFPSWYGWGYGWKPGRGYAPLSEDEKVLVQVRLDEFRQGPGVEPVESVKD